MPSPGLRLLSCCYLASRMRARFPLSLRSASPRILNLPDSVLACRSPVSRVLVRSDGGSIQFAGGWIYSPHDTHFSASKFTLCAWLRVRVVRCSLPACRLSAANVPPFHALRLAAGA
jgi:hypothetical protein